MTKEKTRYSDSELLEFKQLILDRLEKAHQKLGSYRSQLTDGLSDARVKSLDDYSDSMEADILSDLISREEKFIHHLENALVRIENKVYGICRSTGKLIAKERLFIVPHATLSMEAKTGK
jgi:DnaK suppressor protein